MIIALSEFLVGLPLIAVILAILVVDVALFSFEQYAWSIFVMTIACVSAFFVVTGFHDLILEIGLKNIFIKWIPLYISAGIATAIVKWIFHTLKKVSIIKEVKNQFDIKFPEGIPIVDDGSRVIRESSIIQEEEKFSKEEKDLSEEDRLSRQNARVPNRELINRRQRFIKFFTDNLTYDSRKNFPVYQVDFSQPTSVVDALAPRAKNHKGLITIWIYQWPIVLIDSILREFIIRLAHKVATLFDLMFSHFSRKLVAGVTKGL